MKITILIMVFLSLTAAGFFKAASVKQNLYETQGLILLIEQIKERLRYYKAPIHNTLVSVCSSLSKYQLCQGLLLALKTNTTPFEAWKTADAQKFFSEETLSIANEFFSLLGTSGIEGQESLCNGCLQRLNRLYFSAKEEASGKMKIYKSMGLLSGILTVIVFI